VEHGYRLEETLSDTSAPLELRWDIENVVEHEGLEALLQRWDGSAPISRSHVSSRADQEMTTGHSRRVLAHPLIPNKDSLANLLATLPPTALIDMWPQEDAAPLKTPLASKGSQPEAT